MPRGKKKLTLEEKLAKVTADISGLEASLVELKKEKKDLEDQIKQNQIAELSDYMAEKGLSVEDIKNLVER